MTPGTDPTSGTAAAGTAVGRLLRLGDAGRSPAGAVAAIRTSEHADVAAGGWATLPSAAGPGVPMTGRAWVDWASVTKVAATTLLVLRLVEAGELDLDAPVAARLPDAAEAWGPTTLRHLLTHTSGAAPWWPLYCASTDRDVALARVLGTPVEDAPGSTYRYSDLGLVLAGLVVERASGLGLAAAFRSLVADPLGLRLGFGAAPDEHAVTSADSDVVEWTMVATGRPYPVDAAVDDFGGWRTGPVRGSVHDGNAAHALGGVAGHAGLLGPVDDLLTLGTAVCDGRLLGPASLAALGEPVAGHPDQGLGFRRALRTGPDGHGSTWLWHGGFTGTVWALEPRSGTVVAAAATRLHGTTGPLPDGPPQAPHPDPLAGLATGAEIAAVGLGLGAVHPSTTPEEARR